MKETKNQPKLPNDFYLNILENLFLCVFINDSTGKTIYTNPAVLRHYGLTPDFLIEKYPGWGFWEGIVFPPVYKELMEKKAKMLYRQRNLISHNYYTTLNTPVMKLSNPSDVEFMAQIIQENFITSDFKKKDRRPPQYELLRKNLIGESKCFLKCIREVEKAANSDMAILLLGESGTGKTHIAKYIHHYSYRRDKPFHSINCGAIPANLLESELFGYTAGSFTGALKKGKKGIFELTNDGTLFLDEIGDMPILLQVKILHVIENGQFLPIGSTVPLHTNVRIITATNKDLKKAIQEKQFREDLYWRINSFTIKIPSLCEHKKDIIPLSRYYLKLQNEKYGTHKTFYPLVFVFLVQYDWPGNIRELRNMIERLYILTGGNIIYENHFPKEIMKALKIVNQKHCYTYFGIIKQAEKQLIFDAYQRYKTSTRISKELSITQTRAYRLLKMYVNTEKEV